MSIRRALVVCLGAGLLAGGTHAAETKAERRITVLYSADERGEITPCG